MTIHIRDHDLQRVGQVDQYTKLQATERLDGAGHWSLEAPAEVLSQFEGEGLGIEITSTSDSAVTEFGGLLRIDGRGKSADRYEGRWVGVDDQARLDYRQAYPNPVDVSEHATAVRSGTGSTVLLDLVNDNGGPGALSARQFPGLVLGADPATGSDVEIAITGGQSVLDLVVEHARASGLVCRVRETNDRQLLVSVREPRDRTDVVFSAGVGSISGWEYEASGPTATTAITTGAGSGASRTVVEVVAELSQVWPERIERHVDARNEVDLAVAGANYLAARSGGVSLQVDIVDVRAGKHRWVTDYDLGDIVTVKVAGVDLTLQITASTLERDASGERRSLTAGPPINRFSDIYTEQLRRLASAIRSIERA